MSIIKEIKSREILDSRATPTIETTVVCDDDSIGVSSVPAGASLGKYEALEKRDNDPKRYGGTGVLQAVATVLEIIAPKLIGKEVRNQLDIDKTMIFLDGTENKSKLGANAILSVSQAVCKAAAACEKVPTYEHVSHLYGLKKEALKIPTPVFNLINGGKHGAGNLDFQEFHIVPSSQKPYSKSLAIGVEIYQKVKQILIRQGAIHSVGDEGGFAPNLFTNSDALEIVYEAIREAGYTFRVDVFMGLDVAAGSIYENGKYKIKDRSVPVSVDELMEFYVDLVQQYPLISLEDPIQEEDGRAWARLKSRLPNTIVVGDDLLVTNKARVEKAIKEGSCNGLIVKPNQVGTIAEAIEVTKVARKADWRITVSHRSGETNDDFIADFAVGIGADFAKFGAPARGERVAKYNRLLAIEQELPHA